MAKQRMIEFEMPWSPSVNCYYRRVLRGVIINEKGKAYRREAAYALQEFKGSFTAEQRLSLYIEAYPPDKRGRDLDNLLKCFIDSVEYAGVFPNDEQIDELKIVRKEIVKGGLLRVRISECG